MPAAGDKLAFLLDPASYPDRPASVRLIETHFAWVFLTRRFAFKLHKPLRRGRMDYRSLAARERGCREELRLNRRLAPRVYLSLQPLSRGRDGALRLGTGARIEDYLVRMRRVSDAQLLDHALVRGTVSAAKLARVVRCLGRFFDASRPRPMSSAAYVRRLRSQISDNRRALLRLGARIERRLIEQVAQQQRRVLALGLPEIGARSARLIDGHGDLRAEHVCLGPPVCVFDCVEFDAALRRLDPAEEMAQLALDVERLGSDALARELLAQFRAQRREPISEATLQFYLSHRAATRAKLAAWHVGDAQFADERPWVARARADLRTALRHAQRALRAGVAPASRASRRPALQQIDQRPPAGQPLQRLAEQGRDG